MARGNTSHLNPEQKLVAELADPEYRHAFVEGHAKDTIAFQLKQLRKAKEWDQRDVARELGNEKLQPMISRYENPDYGRYSISTLLELAKVFDVALVVRFAPFSELVEWDLTSTPATLLPTSYTDDRQRIREIAARISRLLELRLHAVGMREQEEPQLGIRADAATTTARNSARGTHPSSPQDDYSQLQDVRERGVA